MKVAFHGRYILATIILLMIETCIALFVRDRFIRPYMGDVLVVILIYCFIKSFFDLPVLHVATGVLLFAIGVECLQYFNIVERTGLGDSSVARVIIGTSFSWIDIFCYTAGVAIVWLAESNPLRLAS
jgi:hypothetical protein